MNTKRLCLIACLGLLCAGAARAATLAPSEEGPPQPHDAEPGDLPVPPDSERWDRMRETYMRRLQEMRRKEPDDAAWEASAPRSSGPLPPGFNATVERTDPAYPLLSFRFGLIRTGPALRKSMDVLQTMTGKPAAAAVASILRDAVRQMERAEGDRDLIHRFNTESGGAFVPVDPGAAGSTPSAAPSPAAKPSAPPPPARKAELPIGEEGLPPANEPLGSLLRPAVELPPPGVEKPPPVVSAGSTTEVTPGNQAAATKEALKLAEAAPEDTGKLRNAIAGAEKQASPLLLDLDGNDVADTTTADAGSPDHGAFRAAGAVFFDVSGRGVPRRTEWIKPGRDGLLVLDSNGNGVADSATELFGDTDGFADGFAKLALLDADRDGAIAGRELEHLHAWVDDGDGNCERREMTRVTALGITRISLHHEQYRGSFVRNGRTYRMWDWFPHWE